MQQLPTSEQMATQLTIQTVIGTASRSALDVLRVWLVGLILFGIYG